MRILTFVVLVVILATCSEDMEPRVDQRSFFPLEVGRTWSYHVRKVKVVLGDTSKATYTERISITHTFTNQFGESVFEFKIEDDSLGSWRQLDPWSAWIEANKELIVQEGNYRLVRLMFPFTETLTWNLNKYNTNSDNGVRDICSIKYLSNKDMIQVTDQDDGYPTTDQRSSIYKADVGLVSRSSYQERWRYDKYGSPYLARSYLVTLELIQ